MSTTPAEIAKTIARQHAMKNVSRNPLLFDTEDYDVMHGFVIDVLRQHRRALQRAGWLKKRGAK